MAIATRSTRSNPRIPYGMDDEEDPRVSMTPMIPGAPSIASYGGGAGAGLAPFQQSINNERADNARSAQIFAAAAPLPATDGASAYGSVAASKAARDAYVDRKSTQANRASGNYYLNRGLTLDANDRANNYSDAETGYLGAMTRGTDANTQQILPAQAGVLAAHAGQITGEGRRADAMLPYMQGQMGAETDATRAGTEAKRAGMPFVTPMLKAQLERAGLENSRYGAMTTPMVQGAYDAAAQTDDIFKRMRELTQLERQLNAQKFEGQPQQADPKSDLELQAQRMKLAREEGEKRFNDQPHGDLFGIPGLSILPRSWRLKNRSEQELKDEALKNMTPMTPAERGVPAGDKEGDTGIHKGKPVVYRGGKWVYRN